MSILVIAEQVDGVFRKVSFEALSAARELGGEVNAAVLGSGLAAAPAELGQYGAATIYVADDAALAEYTVDGYTNTLAAIIGQVNPELVMLGATTQGKELAARLSARLDAALATDCVALRMEGRQVVATRPMYGGKVLAEVTLNGTPAIVALRPNVMAAEAAPADAVVQPMDANPGEVRTQVKGKHLETGKLDLTEAEVVVSGGRGMGGDDYSAIEALAGVLGAAVGASRSAVDEGWRSAADQVGQTGKTVSPSLYIACGISGAIQHLAGMSSSKVIVAINKDPEAPIFKKADFGIVGDLFEVVPALTEEIKKLKG
jgi:electron transfer flavoprotein alpha subunit